MECTVTLTSFAAWRAWRAANPWVASPGHVAAVVAAAQEAGVHSDYFGHIQSSEVIVTGKNYREEFHARGLNPRQRAVLDLFCRLPWAADVWGTRVYAPEALTTFALALRGRYARFLGAEYAPTLAQQAALFPIPHQDLLALTFPDGSFDVVLCNEVLEHVPDLPRAFGELARILRGAGVLLATFPFAYGEQTTIVKAFYDGATLQHIGDPEYHGNPVDPEGGSLVFQIPAWDVLDIARAQGFSATEMVFVSSKVRGIIGAELAGIFVLRARR